MKKDGKFLGFPSFLFGFIIKRSESECSHSSKRAQIAPRAQIYKICKAHRATAPCGVARKEYDEANESQL